MNELDYMKQNKDNVLGYWKKRLTQEKTLRKKYGRDIVIVRATLEWFLWMIENERN